MLFHAILLNENGNFRQNLWIAIGLDRVMQWNGPMNIAPAEKCENFQ
jgi:hypothetical protein